MFLFKKSTIIGVLIGVIILAVIFFFDRGLAVGLFLLCLFSGITLFFLSKRKERDKIPQILFLITLLIHLAAVLFICWTEFSPFGGGADYTLYHGNGVEIARRLKAGTFSTEGLHMTHYYSVLIGFLYFLTLPEMIIPQALTAFLAALSCLLVYFICLEIGAQKKWAFLVGLLVSLYPSYLFFGSVLLKDTLVIPLILISLLFCLKLIKKFSIKHFLFFYIALGLAIHFRFYVGFAVMFTFILFWIFWGRISSGLWGWSKLKTKIIYTIIIIPLLGFLPQFSGYGYYGTKPLEYYVTGTSITLYREIFYAPEKPVVIKEPVVPEKPKTMFKKIFSKIFPKIGERTPEIDSGTGSSIVIGTGLENPSSFIINSFRSFIYVLLGPLPWHIRYYNQLVAFLETFPWYVLLFFIIKGGLGALRRYQRPAIVVLFFALFSLAVLSLFINNFGIATRIRIPSFIALLCLIPFGRLKKKEEN